MNCTHSCNQGRNCSCYKAHFDSLGQRMEKQVSADWYVFELLDALSFSALIALPMVLYFLWM